MNLLLFLLFAITISCGRSTELHRFAQCNDLNYHFIADQPYSVSTSTCSTIKVPDSAVIRALYGNPLLPGTLLQLLTEYCSEPDQVLFRTNILLLVVNSLFGGPLGDRILSSLLVNSITLAAHLDLLPRTLCQQICSCIVMAIYSSGYGGKNRWMITFGFFSLYFAFHDKLWIVAILAYIFAIIKAIFM